MYPLLPSLKPCKPVDAIDTRYLSQSHAPLANLLKKALHIELYNEKWFNTPLPTSIPPFTHIHDTLRMPILSLPYFPSVTELHNETHTCPPKPLFEKVDNTFSNPLSPLVLHKSLAKIDFLFFIQYIPEDTIKPCWFIVQVNHHETEILKMESIRIWYYHITILSRHPADKNLCDDVARW